MYMDNHHQYHQDIQQQKLKKDLRNHHLVPVVKDLNVQQLHYQDQDIIPQIMLEQHHY